MISLAAVTKYRYLILAALGIGIFGLLLVYAQPKNTVVLRDDGFHPRTLTVSAGETVTFKNKTDKYFWPASDLHPSHDLYPDFDPQEPIAPDGTWSYTFTEPGTYRYHDHLAASYFGIIRVADEAGIVTDNCEAQGGKRNCWQNEVFIALAEEGIDAAYDVVDRLYETEPGFPQTCHALTHNLGLAAYQFYREDPDSILSGSATACASGFYHGFMEGMIGATGDVKQAAQICDWFGESLGSSSPDARLQCYHGIGHGAIETSVGVTGTFGSVDEVIAEAVRMCEEASTGVDERYRCVSGAFNGIANFYIGEQYGLALDGKEPPSFCERQKDEYKESCYGNLNSVYIKMAGGDLARALEILLGLPESEFEPKSIEYLAAISVHEHLESGTEHNYLAACPTLTDPLRTRCVVGIAHGFLEHGNPGSEYQQALAVCADPSLRSSERDTCYTYVLGTLDSWYSSEKSAEICASVEPELRAYCEA